MNLNDPVTSISGIGSSIAFKLQKLGITSVFDLLYHLPFRYENRGPVVKISGIQAGETVCVQGTITFIKNEVTKKGKFIQIAILSDTSGSIQIMWFNQPFLIKSLKNKQVSIYGKVEFYKNKPAFVSPDYETVTSKTLLHTNRIVPIYPASAGITPKWLRSKIYDLINRLPDIDYWPAPNLPGWKESLQNIHFPQSTNYELITNHYKPRLAYDELFLLIIRSLYAKSNWQQTKLAHAFKIDYPKYQEFLSHLSFELTQSQKKVISEILTDLSQDKPMNRLLEGDVGSGKTVVSAVAIYQAYLNDFQSVILAPTQILALQHYETLSTLFRPLNIEISLITGNVLNVKKNNQIIVGTHALLSEKNQKYLNRVGLVVIDEQHRFGVLQRNMATLLGNSPHVLTMTATPIPRSIALTMFGDLDLSVIDEKPANRLPIKTWIVPENKRINAYEWINNQIRDNNTQGFIVCPFIDQSESIQSVKSANTEYLKLKKVFPNLTLGLLHGRLTNTQKQEAIDNFRSGKTQILVSTPIVEVGIDIKNASLMVIEEAQRFGLAALHQLRGRVGRGDRQSYCLLFTSDINAHTRLKALENLDSGILLAEADLKYRGPGEIYGTAQHGFPQFKIADFQNVELIKQAKNQAEITFPSLNNYSTLQELAKTDKISLIQPN